MKKYFLLTLLMAFAFGMNATNPPQHSETRSDGYYFDVNIYTYPNTMTYMAVIELDGVEQMREDIEIGFFAGDECRGHAKPTAMYSMLGHYYIMPSLYGNDGDVISTFRLYDHALEQELDVTCTHDPIVFVTNDAIGDPFNPEVFSFISVPTYTITATANPAEGGTITGTGNYQEGENCTLTATPNTGYHFVNWTKNDNVVSVDASYSFVVGTEDEAFVANFEINSYQITATANPTASGTITGTGTYNHFDTCTLTATPNAGYHFVNWTKEGSVVSSDASYSFTVTEAAAFVANFEINSYEITATVNPESTGTVNGTGTYNHFATCTLTATPITGYHFVNWTKDGSVVSSDASYSFTVTEAVAFVANFEINSYEITVSANPTEGGNVTGAGTYTHGFTANLTATPSTGYHFVNWTKNGTVISTNAVYSFTVTEAAAYVANFQLNSYEITATVNPTESGTVTGTGTYNHFETCTLVATPNTGYHFLNWTKDGVVVSTDATYSFTVTEAASFVANFQINSYEITATANPTEGGTVAGGGTFNHFETCTLTATANTGYTFINWTKDGVEVSTEATYSFTVTEGGNYVANFQINSYGITATANPAEGGTITGAGTYNHFETCTLVATANEGYTFVNWTLNGDEVSTETSISFTVTGAAAYVANFQLNSYEITVSVNLAEGGTADGAGTFNHFETCTLTATPSTGYHFVNWTLNGEVVSTDANYSFTVTSGGNYVANFQINSYQIAATANPTAGGTVSGAGTYNHFDTCTLTATVNTGYTFINWTKNGQIVSTDLSFSFVVTEAATYVANFLINSYDITATANPAIGGNVSGAGTYTYGQTCLLTATASEGYTFVNWTKNGDVVSSNPNYSFTVTEDANFVANFSLISYTITATANPTNGGTVSGAGTYNHFEICTLIATPDENFIFVNWTKNGEEVSTSPVYSFTVVEAGSYVANFAPNEFMITATAMPSNGGTVNGAGIYNYGATCTLTATPNIGYHFINWTKEGVVISTNTSFSFTVMEAGSYVAHFDHDDCVITTSSDPTIGGTTTGAGSYHYGSICTLSANANSGYHFTHWTKDGSVVSTRPAFSITVTENAHYVAHFAIDTYYVTVVANPANSGLVTGEAAYQYGEQCTVTAFALEGYHFVRWTMNGTQVSTNPVYTFTVTQNAELVAYFTLNQYQIEVAADPSNAGSVSGGGAYTYGQTATLTATAHSGYAFVNWTKDGNVVSTNATYNFNVTESGSYVAHFTSGTHVVTIGVNPSVGGHASGAGTYAHGASCTVVATPNDGYYFVKWMANGQQVSTQPSYSFTVTENIHLTAYFAIESCTITAEASPDQGGEVSGMGVFDYGEICTLEATPNENYVFVRWIKDGVTVSQTPIYSFTVTGSAHYVAEFQTTEGVGEHSTLMVNVFPNPVVDKLIVETSESVTLLEIFNINGALVYSQKNCSDRIEVQVQDFAFGTYMIRLTTNNAVEVRRFVKE